MSASQAPDHVIDVQSTTKPAVELSASKNSVANSETLNERLSKAAESTCGRFEYCGSAFGHEFHWTEWVFAISLAVAIVTFLLIVFKWLSDIPPEFFNVFLAFSSVVAAFFLWGFARTKTLAGLARMLKSLVSEAQANTRKHQENNRVLAAENDKIVQSLADFKNSIGLVDSAVKDIDEVENKLNTLLKRHQALMDEQKKFDEEHKAFLDIQEKNRLWLKREAAKAHVRDEFSYADMNRDGSISLPKEKEKMKEYVEKAGFKWSADFDKDGDGSIRLWELMVQLDAQTSSEFTFERIKSVDSDIAKLKQDLGPKKKELERILRERGEWKEPAETKAGAAASATKDAHSHDAHDPHRKDSHEIAWHHDDDHHAAASTSTTTATTAAAAATHAPAATAPPPAAAAAAGRPSSGSQSSAPAASAPASLPKSGSSGKLEHKSAH